MPKETKTFVIFRLGEEEFGVEVKNIKEIAKMTTITRVPRAPDFIEGVINLRGSLATVVNLRKRFRFGFEPRGETEADSRIIIAELGGKPVGMLVDAATEVLRIPVSEIEATPEMVTTEVSKKYLKGVGKVENRLIVLLDLERVLGKTDEEEKKKKKGNE
ncbi:MAG: chemotaxis protein CheW [Methanophagales archaeon]|nr:chemotaxis protein CheW [Methanophagales archaeon]